MAIGRRFMAYGKHNETTEHSNPTSHALKSCDNDRKAFEAQQVQLNNTMNAVENYIKQLEILNTNPFQNNKVL